jgi:hypothetical protein
MKSGATVNDEPVVTGIGGRFTDTADGKGAVAVVDTREAFVRGALWASAGRVAGWPWLRAAPARLAWRADAAVDLVTDFPAEAALSGAADATPCPAQSAAPIPSATAPPTRYPDARTRPPEQCCPEIAACAD